MFMSTDFSSLSMMQLSDSFFPAGLYTMSNGLETLYHQKMVTNADIIISGEIFTDYVFMQEASNQFRNIRMNLQ